MKKSLLAVALLGTFAASAFAAPSVTLYGKIDTGLLYTYQDLDNGQDSTNTIEMKSGWNAGSRWGLKGTEDIGNVKVGFQLESGFTSDDGQSAQNSRLFGRQATVSVSGAYGTVYAGRIGGINSDIGSIGLLGNVSPFGSSFTDLGTHGSTGHDWTRYDNTLAYVSPVFAGFKAEAMYSFNADNVKKDKDATENKSSATRYAAAGLQYKNGGLDAVLTGEYIQYGSKGYADLDNAWSVVLGGAYDFGVAKAYAKATYFDNQAGATDSFGAIYTYDAKDNPKGARAVQGWGVSLGAKVPAFGGNAKAEIGYRNAEDVKDSSNEFQRWNATVGYDYAFSKRTSVYATGGYVQEKAKAKAAGTTGRAVLVGAGLVHNF